MRAIVVTALSLCFAVVACGASKKPPFAPTEPSVDGAAAKSDLDASVAKPTAQKPQRILFIGNSYTERNNLASLYSALATATHRYTSIETEAVTPGGQTLAQHAAAAGSDGTDLHRFLVSGTAQEKHWDVVVLQDQSQIPSFPADNAERSASAAGAVELAGRIDALHAKIVLFMTWGHRDGDPSNAQPDFQAMEAQLETGYRDYAAKIRAAGHDVTIAPVGPAFAKVHAEGASAAVVFTALYDGDGSHPSLAGSYLAACVLVATISAVSLEDVMPKPALIDAKQAVYLQTIAQSVVDAERKRKG